MKKFEIEIPNERQPTYSKVAFIILTLNFFGFGYVFIRTIGNATFIAIAALIINAIPWLYFLLNKKHITSPIIEFIFIVSACIWIYFGNLWMGIMLMLFAVMSFFTNKKTVVTVDESGVTYPSFPVKKYLWIEIIQVICKDDILTIDLKENKLLQLHIHKNLANGFDENDFNKFCSVQKGIVIS